MSRALPGGADRCHPLPKSRQATVSAMVTPPSVPRTEVTPASAFISRMLPNVCGRFVEGDATATVRVDVDQAGDDEAPARVDHGGVRSHVAASK